jgi:hypothetical protein
MAIRRKLFMAHAGELAFRLAEAVGRGGLVGGFVRRYAERHERQTVLHDPSQVREIETGIRREALLVMAMSIADAAPQAFASGRDGTPRVEEAALGETFVMEFLDSLGRTQAGALSEAAFEAASFKADLEGYGRWTIRSTEAGKSAGVMESPFSDRCAILLDPSMMEQAKRAAAGFEAELTDVARRMFERLGRGAPRRRRKASARVRKRRATQKKVKRRARPRLLRRRKPSRRKR